MASLGLKDLTYITIEKSSEIYLGFLADTGLTAVSNGIISTKLIQITCEVSDASWDSTIHSRWHHLISEDKNLTAKIIYHFVLNTVPAYGLVPSSARPSAGIDGQLQTLQRWVSARKT